MSCPPFLPEAPQLIRFASTTATLYPRSINLSAADIPVKPPPNIATSQ